jgi:hypothetical protein
VRPDPPQGLDHSYLSKDVNARRGPRGIAVLRHTKVAAFVETP